MRQHLRFLPALIWMGVIFYLSSIPNLELRGELSVYDFVLRKLAHVAEYAILYLLWRRALETHRNASLQAGAITILYAISDEMHQFYVPTRDGKIADVAIDAVGVILGSVSYAWFRQRTQNKSRRAAAAGTPRSARAIR